LSGLAPFYVEDGPLDRRILPIGISLSDYLDVLLDPASADEAGGCIVSLLEDREAFWDGLNLEELAPGAWGLRSPSPKSYREALAPQSRCPVLMLSQASAALQSRLRAIDDNPCLATALSDGNCAREVSHP
jgi:hypothetical protein